MSMFAKLIPAEGSMVRDCIMINGVIGAVIGARYGLKSFCGWWASEEKPIQVKYVPEVVRTVVESVARTGYTAGQFSGRLVLNMGAGVGASYLWPVIVVGNLMLSKYEHESLTDEGRDDDEQ